MSATAERRTIRDLTEMRRVLAVTSPTEPDEQVVAAALAAAAPAVKASGMVLFDLVKLAAAGEPNLTAKVPTITGAVVADFESERAKATREEQVEVFRIGVVKALEALTSMLPANGPQVSILNDIEDLVGGMLDASVELPSVDEVRKSLASRRHARR